MLFIPKYYALSNELAQKSKINISNFSMLKKYAEDHYIDDLIIKFGNCTFVNTINLILPEYIKKACYRGYTDLENCMVTSYLTSEFCTSKKELLKALSIYDVQEIVISGKSFLKCNDKFVKTLKNKVITNITKSDANDCAQQGLIDGSIQLSKNNVLVWYSF